MSLRGVSDELPVGALHPGHWPGATGRGRCLRWGSYRDEVLCRTSFTAASPYDADRIVQRSESLTDKPAPEPSLQSIGQVPFGLGMRGYELPKAICPNVQRLQARCERRWRQFSRMLELRARRLLPGCQSTEVEDVLREGSDRPAGLFRTTELIRLPLYLPALPMTARVAP